VTWAEREVWQGTPRWNWVRQCELTWGMRKQAAVRSRGNGFRVIFPSAEKYKQERKAGALSKADFTGIVLARGSNQAGCKAEANMELEGMLIVSRVTLVNIRAVKVELLIDKSLYYHSEFT
jgi:hypothetical protein